MGKFLIFSGGLQLLVLIAKTISIRFNITTLDTDKKILPSMLAFPSIVVMLLVANAPLSISVPFPLPRRQGCVCLTGSGAKGLPQ